MDSIPLRKRIGQLADAHPRVFFVILLLGIPLWVAIAMCLDLREDARDLISRMRGDS